MFRSALRVLTLLCWWSACDDAGKPAETSPAVDSAPVDSRSESNRDSAVTESTPPGICGDGVADLNEQCDAGTSNGSDVCGCQPDCTYAAALIPCDDAASCPPSGACDGLGSCAAAGLSCDDGDLCTVDRCDSSTGLCTFEAPVSPLDLFDHAELSDPATLDVEVLRTETMDVDGVPVTLQELRYTSFESDGCQLRPIRIAAWLAIPEGSTPADPAPGLVIAHGIGGQAERDDVTEIAGALPVAALAWSGPGCGASEGTAYTADHLFDLVGAPPDSWFWEHTVAGVRALSVLESMPVVDSTRLGMTGTSSGGIASFLAGALDPRLTVVMPVSSAGNLDDAVRATPVPSYWAGVLESMTPPTSPDDPPWASFQLWYDPATIVGEISIDTLMISGAQDQFFPISTVAATFAGLAAAERRLLVIRDWDHGISDYDAAAADVAVRAAQGLWLSWRWALPGAPGSAPPMPPTPAVSACGARPACTQIAASIDASEYTVEAVVFEWSLDGALTWSAAPLSLGAGGEWVGEVELDPELLNASGTASMLRVDYRYGDHRLSLSSEPYLAAGFVPNIPARDAP